MFTVVCKNILRVSGPKEDWNAWMMEMNDLDKKFVAGSRSSMINDSFHIGYHSAERKVINIHFDTMNEPAIDFVKDMSALHPKLDFQLACNDQDGCGMFRSKHNHFNLVIKIPTPNNICTCQIYPEGGGSTPSHCYDCQLPIDPEHDFSLFHTERGLKQIEICNTDSQQ